MEIVRINAQWCTSCILTYKGWKEIQAAHPNNNYRELDYDLNDREVKELNVGDVLPVHIVFDDYGRECARFVGELPKKKLERELSKYLNK